eukprot:2325461-Rhodomonas_salina.1
MLLGLLPLCFAYLDHVGCDTATRDTIRQYAMVLEKRAKGELMTAATWCGISATPYAICYARAYASVYATVYAIAYAISFLLFLLLLLFL